MMPAYRMAMKVHRQLVRELAEAQQRILLIEALQQRFGAAAIVPVDLLQDHNDTLSRGPEFMDRVIKRSENLIAERLETIKELEQLFAQQEASDMEAFAEAMAERMGMKRKSKKRAVATVS